MPNFEQQMQALVDSGERTDVDFGEMCAALLREFGGCEGIAREAYLCMTDPSASPNTKSNIIKNVLSILEAYARLNKDAAPSESQMTDAELLEQAGPFLKQFGLDATSPRLPLHEEPAPSPAQASGESAAAELPAV